MYVYEGDCWAAQCLATYICYYVPRLVREIQVEAMLLDPADQPREVSVRKEFN